ncbi:MAG: hypothetical protein J6S14_23050 [Clostridia bacterium]|nr:hypothetical protein [Clostridia bacterium]
MAFSRKFLLDNGVPEDKVDVILAERNRTLNDYVPKGDVQAQIEKAVEAAKGEPQQVNVLETPEYQELLSKSQKLEAFQTDDFKDVKQPYKDIVWGKLDHAEKHKPYAEQMTELKETMPDLFVTQEEPPKPNFGTAPKGAAPTGNAGPSFNDVWGFGPAKS